jgi:TonB family protein
MCLGLNMPLKKCIPVCLLLILPPVLPGQTSHIPQAHPHKIKATPSGSVQILCPIPPEDRQILAKNVLPKIIAKVKKRWYRLVPREARAPQDRSGITSIRFDVHSNGKVSNMLLYKPCGDKRMDRAAWKAIKKSSPFRHFPSPMHITTLKLQFNFRYNMPTHAPSHTHKHVPK